MRGSVLNNRPPHLSVVIHAPSQIQLPSASLFRLLCPVMLTHNFTTYKTKLDVAKAHIYILFYYMYTLHKCTESCILNSNAAILHVQSLRSVIHNDKPVTCYKDVSEHYRDCNIMGTVVHMHVQGRRQLDLVLLLSGQCNTL